MKMGLGVYRDGIRLCTSIRLTCYMKMGVESYDLIVNIHSVNMLNEIGCISRAGTGIFVQKCITI